MTPKITSTMEIRKPDGTIVSKPYQSAVLESEAVLYNHYYLPGTAMVETFGEIATDTVAHSVHLTGRRVVTRRTGSSLGSTHPFAERAYEEFAEEWQKTTDRTLVVFSKGKKSNNDAKVPPKQVKSQAGAGPDAEVVNTEISLHPIHPVWGG